MVYQMEKMLREAGDKISGSERAEVENAIADAKKALESGDQASMDRARETLTQASHKLAEQMYKAAVRRARQEPVQRQARVRPKAVTVRPRKTKA